MSATTTSTWKELLVSVGVGFLLSVILISFSSGHVQEIKKDEDTAVATILDTEIQMVNEPNVNIYLDEEKVMLKTKFIQNTLGISPNDMKEAVRKTNLELKNGSSVKDIELISPFPVLFDFFVALAVLLVTFYSLNIISKGELGRVASGLFQTELESFNFTKLPFIQYFIHYTN